MSTITQESEENPNTPSPPHSPLTLAQAVELALTHNQQVRAAQFDQDASRFEKREAFSALLPQINIVSDFNKLESDRFSSSLRSAGLAGETYNYKVQVSQMLFDPATVGAIRQAKLREQTAEWQNLGQKQTAVFNTLSAYIEALKAMEMVRIQEQRVTLAQKQLDITKANHEVGYNIGADVSRAMLTLSSAKRDSVSASMALQRAYVALNRTLGQPVDTRQPLAGGYLLYHNPPSAPYQSFAEHDTLYSVAIEKNPSVKIARLLVEQYQATLQSAKEEFYPTLSTGASWGYYDTGTPRFETEEWSVQASVKIPLYEGGRKMAKLRKVKSQLQAQEERFADTEENTFSLLANSVYLIQEEAENLATAIEAEAVAAKSHTVYLNLYQGGMATSLDVTQSLTDMVKAQTDLISARYGYLRVYTQLLYLLGTIPITNTTYTEPQWLETVLP
ncbi:MAG: TolC family protein [bacterium]|nr:TolC family protein [bacterium]